MLKVGPKTFYGFIYIWYMHCFVSYVISFYFNTFPCVHTWSGVASYITFLFPVSRHWDFVQPILTYALSNSAERYSFDSCSLD